MVLNQIRGAVLQSLNFTPFLDVKSQETGKGEICLKIDQELEVD